MKAQPVAWSWAKTYVDWVKLQSNGIGRAMKVGKEGILGLTRAIESYITLEKETGQQMIEKMTPFISQLNTIDGVSAKVVWDAAGRDIARTEISFDEIKIGRSTPDLVDALKMATSLFTSALTKPTKARLR